MHFFHCICTVCCHPCRKVDNEVSIPEEFMYSIIVAYIHNAHWKQYVTGFRKISHFVTFDTLNISSSNKALHCTNQPFSEHRISLCYELLEMLWIILKAACVLLWQQCKVVGSIYFTRDEVVDFPTSNHILSINHCKTVLLSISLYLFYLFWLSSLSESHTSKILIDIPCLVINTLDSVWILWTNLIVLNYALIWSYLC